MAESITITKHTGPTVAEAIQQPPLPLDHPLSSYTIRAILEDHAGALWFGTFGGGLNRVHEGQLRVFTSADGLAGDFVLCLHEDRQGVLWIGTRDGLSRLRQGSLVSIKSGRGLPEGEVNNILEDDFGRLWLGGRSGIFSIELDQLNAVAEDRLRSCAGLLYDESDGMLSSDIHGGHQPSACKSRDGKLWFPTSQGLVMIDSASVDTRMPPPPRVFIESIVTAEQKVDVSGQWSAASDQRSEIRGQMKPADRQEATSGQRATDNRTLARATSPRPEIPDPKPEVFPPGSGRLVEIRFAALDYSAPEKLRFKHRREGFDRNWVDAGANREVRYTNLRPGR